MFSADLLETLKHTWQAICDAYDLTTALPDMQALFEGVELGLPDQASEIIVANMLSEVMECVGRFSPWYKAPAGAFGLSMVCDDTTGLPRWILSSEALQQRQALLRSLAVAVEKNITLILSVNFIDSLEDETLTYDSCVMASCLCVPPRIIVVNRQVLLNAKIICHTCQHPFQPIDETPNADSWIN